MRVAQLYLRLHPHQKVIGLAMAPALLLLVGGIYGLVHATGGIKYVYSHSMYLPILLAGLAYGLPGGILIGIAGGIVLGPFMPIEVATGEPQKAVNWLYRTGFFVLVGGLSGIASDAVRVHVRHLQWLARHDSATGLLNRTALLQALEQVGPGIEPMIPRVLGVISIRNSAELRSVFGFEVIEDNIPQLAARLAGHLPKDAEIFRAATEQLGFLVESGAAGTAHSLSSISSAFQLPFLYNGVPIHLDTLIGFVAITDNTEAAEGYLRKAQAASLLAAESGEDVAHYHAGIHRQARENLAILGELTEGIERGEISLHYQPKVSLRTGAVCGVEALMRWQHRTRGMIAPGVFIPRAEQSTLIHALTRFALERALSQVVAWQAAGIRIPVAVNVSPRNLLQPDFCSMVLETLERCGAAPDMLELEVTEGALMTDVSRVAAELQRLSEHGVQLAIDDFGAGYSSLAYLHRLPVAQLKIDKAFIQGLQDEAASLHIVEAVVSLARKTGIRTVAEGVESPEVYALLGDLDCDVAQGFAIARPMPAEDFVTWYQQWCLLPHLPARRMGSRI